MNDKERDHFAINPIWAPIPWACVVNVSGEDAAEFLQGQFSQDLRDLQADGVAYGFWLTRTGKVQGDAWVVAGAEGDFVVLSRSMPAAELMARFEHHIIADEVYLEDVTAGWEASWWAGEGVVAALDAERAKWSGGEGWILPELPGLPGGSAYRIARAKPAGGEAEQVDAMELERRRIGVGLGQVPADVGADDLPQEGGLALSGVSFNKGCYLGQEVMARVQTTGRVRRRLVKVRGEGTAPTESVEPLFVGDREVGTLRSRVGLPDGAWIGLAMVGPALAELSEGALHLGAADGPMVRWTA